MLRLGERTESMGTLVEMVFGKPTVTTQADAHALCQGLHWPSIFAFCSFDLHSPWKQKSLCLGKSVFFYLKWPFLCSGHGFPQLDHTPSPILAAVYELYNPGWSLIGTGLSVELHLLRWPRAEPGPVEGRCTDMSTKEKARHQAASPSVLGVKEVYSLTMICVWGMCV